jgi:S1-C subfamily serine protease
MHTLDECKIEKGLGSTRGRGVLQGLRSTTRDSYGRLVLGDIITSLNNQKVSNGSDLYKILDRCKVGDTATVEVLRGDQKMKVPVVLESRD